MLVADAHTSQLPLPASAIYTRDATAIIGLTPSRHATPPPCSKTARSMPPAALMEEPSKRLASHVGQHAPYDYRHTSLATCRRHAAHAHTRRSLSAPVRA